MHEVVSVAWDSGYEVAYAMTLACFDDLDGALTARQFDTRAASAVRMIADHLNNHATLPLTKEEMEYAIGAQVGCMEALIWLHHALLT